MNKYLVTYEIEGEICEPVIETAPQIFDKMDLDDCYDIHIVDLRWLKRYKNFNEMRMVASIYPSCEFHGTWHNGKDPLRMEIREKFGDMEVLDVGYGSDH